LPLAVRAAVGRGESDELDERLGRLYAAPEGGAAATARATVRTRTGLMRVWLDRQTRTRHYVPEPG